MPAEAQGSAMKHLSRNTALEVVMDSVELMNRLLDSIRSRDKSLYRQLNDSFGSVILNLGEADGNRAGTRRERLLSAQGSNTETQAGLRLAAAWRYIDMDDANRAITYLDRAARMTYRRLQQL